MFYLSTRDKAIKVLHSQAILNGIAADGGLNIPENFDELKFNPQELESMSNLEISERILGSFFTDFTKEEIKEVVKKAYVGKFPDNDIAPLSAVGDDFVMELYHGPTCAFKDVALSALPHLMIKAKEKNNVDETVLILTATSGDTGSAALTGFADVPGTKIIVFYPKTGISVIQERQMTTCKGKNVNVCAVEGNFDDAQRGVKQIFANAEKLREEMPGIVLSSANSINIGRLAPQIAYYFKAYKELMKNGTIKCGEPVNFTVPTGNFGDILAGYFAKKMGLPVGKLICASNQNDVLTEFFETGIYRSKRPFHITKSPSMDILVSSNLERLICMVAGHEKTKEYMKKLAETGEYKLTSQEHGTMLAEFDSGCANDEETLATIKSVYREHEYLMDTHTAVAWKVCQDWKQTQTDPGVNVILSTASPYKFAGSVIEALTGQKLEDTGFELMYKLHEMTGSAIPESLEAIKDMSPLHNDVTDKNEMQNYIIEKGRN
ncbi:MAG: threonine synthase [Eubacteriales bacterium]|nr:threonine synthase [Eubacteriales bacterium]